MCNCCCPQTTRCTRFQVTFNSIEVSDIDDGFLGGSLETTWTFVVNGQVQILTLNSLDTGVRTLGVTFFADVPTDSSAIVIQVSGIEDDAFFPDRLPGFTHVWGLAQNFGQGVQSGAGSNSSITYRMSYTITCAQQVTVALSRERLMAYAQDKAKTRKGVKEPMSPATLLSWSLDRLCRASWDLVQATDREFIFKGYGSLPRLIEQKYGGEQVGEPKKAYGRGQGGEPKKAAE
jgi:hypothetical protein